MFYGLGCASDMWDYQMTAFAYQRYRCIGFDRTLVTHSMGGDEAVRYVSRHGSGHVAPIVLLATTTPKLLQTDDNPARLLPNCRLLVYPGAPHGLMYTHMDRLHADILNFTRGLA